MKKICVLLAVMMLVVTAGCDKQGSGSVADEMAKKTIAAIEDGRVEKALDYGEIAISEGYDNDEFEEILECLEIYLDAKEALDENDLKTAGEKYKKFSECDKIIVSNLITELEEELDDKKEEVNDIIESLEDAIEDDDEFESLKSELKSYVLTDDQERKLKKIIEKYEDRISEDEDESDFDYDDGDDDAEEPSDVYYPSAQEIDGYIESLKEGMDNYDATMVASMMVKLYRLEPYMNEHQRNFTFSYWNEWNQMQKEIEPPVMISPEEAIEIARDALGVSSAGCIVAVQCGEYYVVRAETDYGDYVDECGCCVSTYDGMVSGEIG